MCTLEKKDQLIPSQIQETNVFETSRLLHLHLNWKLDTAITGQQHAEGFIVKLNTSLIHGFITSFDREGLGLVCRGVIILVFVQFGKEWETVFQHAMHVQKCLREKHDKVR